ncbi:hypothetical protein [Streptomyces luteireticuli]|uniref:XRE family transcriptional regulator n=1 Tax=Streptomyces luteireticuli TaxID=173858 RepID=A0ABN0YR90_9ACTN
MFSLTAKLAHLLRRKPGADGEPLSNRALADRIRAQPGYAGRGGSHAAIHKLRVGTDNNPTVSTVDQLAQALEAPSAFLLPGWDDLEALTVFQQSAEARAIVRHLQQLPPEELAHILTYVQGRREELGLKKEVPPEEITPAHDSGDTAARFRRRRTREEAARYAADSLEGI